MGFPHFIKSENISVLPAVVISVSVRSIVAMVAGVMALTYSAVISLNTAILFVLAHNCSIYSGVGYSD
ncbi:MAG: hypothetical protein R2827_12085 [Bdellovibrionales bacterium]